MLGVLYDFAQDSRVAVVDENTRTMVFRETQSSQEHHEYTDSSTRPVARRSNAGRV